jgi:phosphate transport system substrate-binding protein
VKFQRYGAVAGVAVAAALALSACGSNNNGGSTGGSTATGSSGSSASASSAGASCPSGTLNMAGSTAQQNAISQWTKDYQTQCSGVTVNYNGNGSGSGFTSFVQKQADVAGSDYALSATQVSQATSSGRCGTGSVENIPAVPGAIAVIYNVPNLSKALNLSAKTLAGIYDGTITNWNASQIATDNPGVTLPNLKIQPFDRSDTSGTSYNFSNYLHNLGGFAAANKQFPSTVAQGEKGSAAVASKVKATAGSIGYAEYSYATSDDLSYAEVSNAAGTFVPLTQANAANFISQAKVTQSNGTTLAFNYQYSSATAYPNVLVTYEFVCATGNSSSQLPLIKGFLNYIVGTTAQGELTGLGYVQLPSAIASADQTAINALQ